MRGLAPNQVTALCHSAHIHLQAASRTSSTRPLLLQRSLLHHTSIAYRPRQRSFFTSNPNLGKEGASESPSSVTADSGTEVKEQTQQQGREPSSRNGSNNSDSGSRKKKVPKAAATKKKLRDPLRRVASIAQRASTRKAASAATGAPSSEPNYANSICAICVAEAFDMKAAVRRLQTQHYLVDPDGLDFDEEEVIHARTRGDSNGDFFIFESGSVVTWSLPPSHGVELATSLLLPTAKNPHNQKLDLDDMTEQLEYEVDPSSATNTMRWETVVLGTRGDESGTEGRYQHHSSTQMDTGRAKIAYSSGLARSTKVAVLEAQLNAFLERTEYLPAMLESGRPGVSKKQILRQTGELLRLRSQLNFFSELTDSLPDKLWDQNAELKLDSLYDQVATALDVRSRIKILNQRMDYADHMLDKIKDNLDQTHGSRLEWIIIWLILIEVVFHMVDWRREYKTTLKKGEAPSELDFWEWLIG